MTTTQTSRAPFAELARAFHGSVILPEDPRWDAERVLWNSMFDRQPLAIAKCTGDADVVAAVRFARAHDLPISVRSGGHDAGGKSVLDDTFVIDLKAMDGVVVDADRRRALVQGGATWRLVDRESQLHGLAVTGGTVSDTGVAGLTLGGGVGWLMRRAGVTVDSLVALSAVTADGEPIRITPADEPDLFWGMCGAGANFAIATSFEFALHPVGPEVLAGMVIHPGDDAAGVIRHWRDYMDHAPDAVGSMLLVMRAAAPLFPPEYDGKPVVGFLVVHADGGEQAERDLRPLREWGNPIVDGVAPTPYVEIQRVLEQGWPPKKRFYEKSGYLSSMEDAYIEEVVDCLNSAPITNEGTSAKPLLSAMPMGAAIDRVPDEAMAFSRADCAYWWDVAVMWEDEGNDDAFMSWSREVYERLRPFASGRAYINLMVDDDQTGDWVRSAYGPEKYSRLVQLKNRWDPENVFRGNKNIPPSQAG